MSARARRRRAQGGVRVRPSRARRIALEILLGALAVSGLLWVALQRVDLGGRPTYLGSHYAALAADPFHPAPGNPVGHRILAPLLSWAVGLRGIYLLYTNLFWVAALVAAVYAWFRARGHAWPAAAAGGAAVAWTAPALTTLRYGGYPDALMHLLVFAAWCARGRLWLSSLCAWLAFLTHEGTVFLAPWLWLVLARAEGAGHGWRRATLGVVAPVAAFAAIRWLLERAHPGVEYTAGFYLAPLAKDPLHWFRAAAPHAWLGIGAAFHLFWVFPCLSGARCLVRRRFLDAALVLLPVPCALVQLLVAYDVTRLAALAAPAVLLGLDHMLRADAWRARIWAPLVAAASLLVPQVNVAMGVIDRMRR